MTSILNLPPELLGEIAYFVSIKDPVPHPRPRIHSSLAAMALTCRYFRTPAQEQLFRDLKFTWRLGAPNAKVAFFFQFLIDHPDLALRVRILSLDVSNSLIYQPQYPRIKAAIYTQARALIAMTSFSPERKKIWVEKLNHPDFAHLALWGAILMKLKNLNVFRLTTCIRQDLLAYPQSGWAHLVAYMFGGWSTDKRVDHSLRGYNFPRVRAHADNPVELTPSLRGLDSVAALSNIHTLEIDYLVFQTQYGWQLNTAKAPDFRNIKHLKIDVRSWRHDRIPILRQIEHIWYIIEAFPSLKTLELEGEPAGFDWTPPSRHSEEISCFNARHGFGGHQNEVLCNTLQHVANTLEELTMPGGGWVRWGDAKFKADFRGFKKLRCLTVPHGAITYRNPLPDIFKMGRQGHDVNPWTAIKRPQDSLPRTLQYLCVFDANQYTLMWLRGMFAYDDEYFTEFAALKLVVKSNEDLQFFTEAAQSLVVGTKVSVVVEMEDLEDRE